MSPKVGAGNITISLGGDDESKHEYVLVPTLAAAQGISRTSGGIRGAIDKVIAFDLDTITNVVRLGLGPRVVKEIGQDFNELVWRAGMTDTGGELVARCIEYLSVLSNGGRPLPKAGEAREEGNPQ